MTRRLKRPMLLLVMAELLSAGDRFEVKLRPPDDGIFAGEEAEIEMRIEDRTRIDPVLGPAVVVRARVEVTIEMPAMPGMPRFREVAHAEDLPGVYGVHPSFAHAGDYLMRVSVTPPGEHTFHVEFPLLVLDGNRTRKQKPRPPRFQMELAWRPKTPTAGVGADLRLSIRDRENPQQLMASFEPMHERLLHLFIVRADLGEFAHVHPDLGDDGAFRLRYTFPTGGDYRLFAEVAPRGAGSQTMLAKVRVKGPSGRPFDLAAAGAHAVRTVGNVEVATHLPQEPLPVRRMIKLDFSLRDAVTRNAICDLEPYLGAMGHLILIHQDGETLVHSHPDEQQPDVGRDGNLRFLARFPKTGLYRGWCQFQRAGSVLTVDFTMQAGSGIE